MEEYAKRDKLPWIGRVIFFYTPRFYKQLKMANTTLIQLTEDEPKMNAVTKSK